MLYFCNSTIRIEKKMLDRKNPPLMSDLGEFNFPKFKINKLKNKVKVFSLHNPNQTMTGIKLIVKDGANSETIPGTAFSVGQMLSRGTNSKSAQEIALQSERLGTSIGIHAGWDALSASAVTLTENFDEILDLVLECVNDSKFDENELDIFRNKHIANIKQEMVDPNFLARFAFAMDYYQGHDYGHPMIGSTETISSMQSGELINWYEHAKNHEVGIVLYGNYDEQHILEKLETAFSSWKNEVNSDPICFKNTSDRNRVVLIEKPEASQTTFCIGREIVGRDDPDFIKLQFANVMFGGYFLSRLNEVIREEMGLTYGIYSQLDIRRMGNTMMIMSGVNKSLNATAMEAVNAEIKKFAADEITPEEFERAKQYVLGSFLRSVETQSQMGGMLANLFVNDLDENYYGNYFNSIKSLEIGGMQEVRKRFFDPEKFIIAAAGDIDFMTKELSSFGEIRIAEKI
jgi:zinc protease